MNYNKKNNTSTFNILKHGKLFTVFAVFLVLLALPITILATQTQHQAQQHASTVTCNFFDLYMNQYQGDLSTRYTIHAATTCSAIGSYTIDCYGSGQNGIGGTEIISQSVGQYFSGYVGGSFTLSRDDFVKYGNPFSISCHIYNNNEVLSTHSLSSVHCTDTSCPGVGGNPGRVGGTKPFSGITQYQCGGNGLGRCASIGFSKPGYRSIYSGANNACASQLHSNGFACLYPFDQCAGNGTGLCSAPNIACTGNYHLAYVDNNRGAPLACQRNGLLGYQCCVANTSAPQNTPTPQYAGPCAGLPSTQSSCMLTTYTPQGNTACPSNFVRWYQNTPGNNQNGSCGRSTTSNTYTCCISPDKVPDKASN